MDFNIEHYLSEEAIAQEHSEEWHKQFYGDIKDKPETEQELFELQEQYKKTKDSEVWRKMFSICYDYMKSLVLKRCIGKCFLSPEQVKSKASSATIAFMSQYLRNPTFEVGASFAGMMGWKIVEALYGEEDDKCWSLNSPINKEGDELLEVINEDNLIFKAEKQPDAFVDKVDCMQIVNEVLQEADKELDYDPRLSALIRVYLLLYFRKPRSRHAKRFFQNKLTTNTREVDILDRVVLEVYNRLKN